MDTQMYHLTHKYPWESSVENLTVGQRVNVPGLGPCTVEGYDASGNVMIRDGLRTFRTISAREIHPGEWRRFA